jgi:hypothetical protein
VPEDRTPFFLSHARATPNPGNRGRTPISDRLAERFFFDLEEDVGQLISRETGADIGFLDTGVQGEIHWIDTLLHAVGTCQVLIPLISTLYLSCEWCGKAWCAFAKRASKPMRGASAAPYQGHIIPVRWTPVGFPLPAIVDDELWFSPKSQRDPDLPARYEANGLYGLLRMKEQDSYRMITWQLAMLISKIYHTQHLEVREFTHANLENVFQAG